MLGSVEILYILDIHHPGSQSGMLRILRENCNSQVGEEFLCVDIEPMTVKIRFRDTC
jgi:hypothetical protein